MTDAVSIVDVYTKISIVAPVFWSLSDESICRLFYSMQNTYLQFYILFSIFFHFIVRTPSILRSFCSYSVCHSPLPYLNVFVLSANLITSLLTPFSRLLMNMLNSTVPTTQTSVYSMLFLVFSQCYALTSCLVSFF